MRRNNRGNNGFADCADVLALFVLAVNAVGVGAFYKSPHSAGGIAGLAVAAVVDTVLLGAGLYGLYQCCKPKPSQQQREYHVGLLSDAALVTAGKPTQPTDVEAGALDSRLLYPR
ncbi:MAG: hypothetical protein P1U63_07895 [Coxiellaceae bacterium]|nr:hypothetical protein [Coxiellaceae bacterium]